MVKTTSSPMIMVQAKNDIDINTVYAFQHNDTRAFTRIFNYYYPLLVFFATRLIDNKSSAEEITETIFVKLWERREKFETSQNIKAFLYIATRNSCMDYLRKAKRQVQSKVDLTSLALDQETHIHTEIIHAEVLGEIYQEIEHLPPRCKEVFKLSFIEGLRNQEIADNMGITVNTVKNQKARAVELLKTVLLKKNLWILFLVHLHQFNLPAHCH